MGAVIKKAASSSDRDFSSEILGIFASRNATPLTEAQLAKRLHVSSRDRQGLRDALNALEQKRAIRFGSKGYERILSKNEIEGIISVHRRGFGFVTPLRGSRVQDEVFVPKEDIGGAVQGDTVAVQTRKSLRKAGYEGRVVRVVKRAHSELVGIVTEFRNDGVAIHVPLLGREVIILAQTGGLTVEVGDRVVLAVKEWGDTPLEIRCEIATILGHINDGSVDIPFVLRESRIRHRFPPLVNQAAAAISEQIHESDLQHRLDLRSMASVTIDPASAKDFDDALFVTCDAQGGYELWVHIADVTHYVRRDSVLDKEASLRCNSTYFPGRCIPMLPPVLSDNLCSLKPNVDRLAVSVHMLFDSTGTLLKHRIQRSVIRSQRRFSYEEAKQILDGKLQSPFYPMLVQMVELCHCLKKQRRERGSIEFSLPEMSIAVDRHGNPTGAKLIEYDITHQLVEEFMLKANEVVAVHLTELGHGVVYRVHDEPAVENLEQFRELAGAFGFTLPENPTIWDLQTLFDQAIQSPYGEYLAIAYIRSMKLATYSPDNIGHYGLSLEHYCHFTSPIRRYADLIIHRILLEEKGYATEELIGITKACSDQERISSRAEEGVTRTKKLRLLSEWHANDKYRQYDAVVTRVNPAGIAFELIDLMLEGFLHVSQFDWDYYVFDERTRCLRGEASGRSFHSGIRIQVGVMKVDLVFGEVTWYLVTESTKRQGLKAPKRRRK